MKKWRNNRLISKNKKKGLLKLYLEKNFNIQGRGRKKNVSIRYI